MTTDHAAERAADEISGQSLISSHCNHDEALKDIAVIIAQEYSGLIAAAAAVRRNVHSGCECIQCQRLSAVLRKIRGET